MADAVYDAHVFNSQLTDIAFEFAQFSGALKRLQSAAAALTNSGESLLRGPQSDPARAPEASPPQESPRPPARSPQIDPIDRLNELVPLVHCAWLAAGSIDDRGDGVALQAVLEHAAFEVQKLSRAMHEAAVADERQENGH